jgi:hypothetical protein
MLRLPAQQEKRRGRKRLKAVDILQQLADKATDRLRGLLR